MPPAAIKTIRDLIYWQYAKIVSDSAGFGKRNWRFVMDRFKKFQEEEIFWNQIREYVKEQEKMGECIFCGKKGAVTLEHLFPRHLGGLDDEKNVVWVCSSCNSKKGGKRLYEFYTSLGGLESAKYGVPRIAEGKYLKFLYELFREKGLLEADVDYLTKNVCLRCDLKSLCAKEKSGGKLSPLCLDGLATLCLSDQPDGSRIDPV